VGSLDEATQARRVWFGFPNFREAATSMLLFFVRITALPEL
jgi:hypothetical protein